VSRDKKVSKLLAKAVRLVALALVLLFDVFVAAMVAMLRNPF
jgi:hypothetical protein